MRPRPSGGGTAQDPVDITLSDTEPISSDAPHIISSIKAVPPQSSSSDVTELMNGKRVRLAKEVRDVGEASTSQLAPDVPAAKRSRHSSTATTSSAAVSTDQAPRKKSTARKSTQDLSSAQRHRWAAARASDFAAAAEAEGSDNSTHEEAMRQAATERRQSQPVRKSYHSPTKSNAEAGPGPSTMSQQYAPIGLPKGIHEANKAVVVSSPTLVQSSSPDPISLRPDIREPDSVTASDSLVPVSAPVTSSGRFKPSPFQICDTPGSWGSAIPMAVPRWSRPRSHIPKMAAARLENPTVGPSVSQKNPVQSKPIEQPAPQMSVEMPVQTTKTLRRGPTWKTSESPPPPPQALIINLPPPQRLDLDELDMEETSITDTGADLGGTSLINPLLPPRDDSIHGKDRQADITMAMATYRSPTSDRSSPLLALPDLPVLLARQLDFESDTEAVATAAEEVKLLNTGIDLILSTSKPVADDAMDGRRRSDLTVLNAALLDSVQAESIIGVDHAIEISDLTESLSDDMNHVDLCRSRASSSRASFEEIPAEIARTQAVFSRPATQFSRHVAVSRLVKENLTSAATQGRGSGHKLDQLPRSSATPRPEAGPSRPKRLKLKEKERKDSESSSSSGSPSKRLSTRLASRTLTPVYSFSKATHSPIKWRQTVEMDGESDVEELLRAPSRAESSGSSSMTIDGIERTLTATFNIPIVDASPPPERRSRAIRHFDTQLIDEWNKMSPGLTHNPALHRLIFESYIDQCVDGNEPEIKVYNTVDLESIPPHFEFQYSNNMLYNEDVPEPELGLGCDCEGGCSETSKTCSCLKRQILYNFNINEGFAYGEHGNLKQPVPIWECGQNCGCPPECMNRVVQRGRTDKALIDIFKTKKKGWGVRARSTIAAGTFLGIYAGEVIPEAESERRGKIYERAGRTYLFDCDGYQIANPPAGLDEVDSRLAVLARDSAARAAQAAADEDYPGTYNAYSIDAFHYGNFTRFFNHCCDPNLQIVQAYVNDFHPERPLLVIFTLHEVKAGEELCISYKGLPDEEEEVPDYTKKSGKRRKITKPKMTAAVHVTSKKDGLKDKDICYCGAHNCDGIMFNRST